MNELALFAGAGGGVLGGKLLGWRTVLAVERDPYCRRILMRRQDDGHLGPFPVWDDVRTFRRDNPETAAVVGGLAGMDRLVVTAGFPCQPYSAAGKRRGAADDRNLWPDTVRVVREVGPGLALLENVPGLLRFDYFGEVLGDLADAGYDAEWDVVSAACCGAPHLRRRLWILAYRPELADGTCSRKSHSAKHGQGRGKHVCEEKRPQEGVFAGGRREDVADADGRGFRDGAMGRSGEGGTERIRYGGTELHGAGEGKGKAGSRETEGWWSADPADGDVADADREPGGRRRESPAENDARYVPGAEGSLSVDERWGTEPGLGRVADGVADRVDRLRAVGNGQVPVVAAVAFLRLAFRAGLDLNGWVAPEVLDGTARWLEMYHRKEAGRC